jgi:hypothetical protein
MPETVPGELITSAIAAAEKMHALVCTCAPATEVALAAVVLRDLIAELERQRLANEVLRDHGDERYADGVEDGIVIRQEQILAEQAAEAEERRAAAPRLHVIRQLRATGAHPVMPRAAGSA